MITLYDATIDCDAELRKVYEWAYGEFETDENGERTLDDKRLPTPINPLRFPLQRCQVTHFGGRIVISIPKPERGSFFRIDELAKCPAPKRVSKGNKEIYQISGVSDRLLRQNVEIEHALVNFTVTKWSAEHLPNQKLQMIEKADA
jgi:hypothetical protein